MRLYRVVNFGKLKEDTQNDWDNADRAAVIYGMPGPGLFFFSHSHNKEPTALQKLIAFVEMWLAEDDTIVTVADIRRAGIHSMLVRRGLSYTLRIIMPYDAWEKNEHRTIEEFRMDIKRIRNGVFAERKNKKHHHHMWTFDETVSFLRENGMI